MLTANCNYRAELGRAAWKVLHTTFARFPEKPNTEEKDALRQYVHLFQRLYPWYDVVDSMPIKLTNRSQWRVCRPLRVDSKTVSTASLITECGSSLGLSCAQRSEQESQETNI